MDSSPERLPVITMHHIRIGKAAATIRLFRSDDGTTDYEVLEAAAGSHELFEIWFAPSPEREGCGTPNWRLSETVNFEPFSFMPLVF